MTDNKEHAGTKALRRYWKDQNMDDTQKRSPNHGKGLMLRLSQVEYEEILNLSEKLGLSRVELVVRAVRAYKG